MNNPPFQPPHMPTTVPGTVPGGGWNWRSGPWEDGGSIYANAGPILYNGQTQTRAINTANPPPPRNFSPNAAPPSMSQIP